MHNRRPNTARGCAAISETKALLRRISFSESRGAYLKGDRVSVLIDPRYNDDLETIRVLITCHAFGHQEVEWADYGIRVEREREQVSPSPYSHLNARGQALFSSLFPGNYSLTLLSNEDRCRELTVCAQDPKISMVDRDRAVLALIELVSKSGRVAKAALLALFDLLCNSSLPTAMRVLVAQSFTSDTTGPLRETDLTPYSKKFLDIQDVQNPENLKSGLEQKLCRAVGNIISHRNPDEPDVAELLGTFVTRSRHYEAMRGPQLAVRTSGPAPPGGEIRTRGQVRTPKAESPLFELAKTGGRKVRDALVKLLGADPGSEDLISDLRRIDF